MAIRTIEALDPALRHAQTPAVLTPNHQYYEWWYFEIDFAVPVPGKNKPHHWRVITSLHYPHGLDPHRVLAHQRYKGDGIDYFTRYGDDPSSYAGVASYIVDVENTKNVALLISRVQPAMVPTRVSVSKPGDPTVDIQIGNSSFKENPDGSFTLDVKQSGIFYFPGQANRLLRLNMKVKFKQNTAGFQPPNGLLIEQTGVKHHWACVMPNPILEIDHIKVERARRRSGFQTLCEYTPGAYFTSGYHDHQWGDDLIYKQIVDWSWGRLMRASRGANVFPPDKVLFFDVNGVSSPTHPGARPDPVIVDVPGDGTHVDELGKTPGEQAFRLADKDHVGFKDGCKLGIQGQQVPYYEKLFLRTTAVAGDSRNFNVEHTMADNVDTWPFYLRFMPSVVDFHSGKSLVGISEYMRADRLTQPKAQKILALSDKMTYLE